MLAPGLAARGADELADKIAVQRSVIAAELLNQHIEVDECRPAARRMRAVDVEGDVFGAHVGKGFLGKGDLRFRGRRNEERIPPIRDGLQGGPGIDPDESADPPRL